MYEWIGKLTADKNRRQQITRIAQWIPSPMLLLFFQLLGLLIYWRANGMRMQMIRNMSELLPGISAKEVRQRCRQYFFHLCTTLYEILFVPPMLSYRDKSRFLVEGEAHLQEALQQGKGAILFTSHTGNFFYYYWYLTQRYRCLTVVTAKSKELRPLYLLFQQLGCEGLDYDETPPLELVRTLRRHLQQNGVVFLLGDFWRPTFPPSSFFGKSSNSPGGTALLALEYETPIIPFYGCRERGFTHRLVFAPPLPLHREFVRSERTLATNRLNHFLEDVVRRVPEQWLYWFNVQERWR